MAEPLEDTKGFLAKLGELTSQTKAVAISKEQDDTKSGQDTTPGPTPIGPPQSNEDAANRARGHNWAAPQAYDYSMYHDDGNTAAAVSIDPTKWASTAVKYEWKDEYGDVPPRNAELERELFQSVWNMAQGDHMQALDVKVVTEGPEEVLPILKFEDAGLHPVMLENIKLCNYAKPTPIQAYCIPAVLKGVDVVACAQTGSGKTGAYLIPIFSRLAGKYKKLAAPRPGMASCDTEFVRAEPLVLIVAPTRELATQIFDQARRLSYRTMLRPCVAYGGGPVGLQRMELQKGCDVLIATPGRLKDFMSKPAILSLRRVKFTVLDEADELLQPSWEDDLQKIMAGGDANEDADHTYMMFSATFNKEARQIARQYMANDYLRIRVGRAGSTHENVAQQVVFVEENLKREALYDLLFSVPPARTLIFVNSKGKADLIDDFLFNKQLPSTSIHSDRTQREREDAMVAFRTGKAPILVTTGVTARGLDIKNVMHVINFDLPSMTHGGVDEYVHRIGRTARIGNEGLATSFYNDRNEDIADDLVKILLESNQAVPDFLSDRVPEDNKIVWDDTSEEEANLEAEATDDESAGKDQNSKSDHDIVVKAAPPDKWNDAAVDNGTSAGW